MTLTIQNGNIVPKESKPKPEIVRERSKSPPRYKGTGYTLGDGEPAQPQIVKSKWKTPRCCKDPIWRIALSCTPVIGGVVQIINEWPMESKLQTVRAAGNHAALIQGLEQKNRYKLYAVASYALPIIAAIVLIAVGILSASAAIVLPMAFATAIISWNIFCYHLNQQQIHRLQNDPRTISQSMIIY